MSFDKIEVRVFSGPDQVQVGSNTEPDLIVINNGPKGDPGNAATIAVGTTTTLSPGSSATVANAGTSNAAVFNFGIPTGATGATGAAGPNSVTSATTSDGTGIITFASVGTPIVKATTSAGVSARTNGGTECFSWGAGNGQNFTFTAGTGIALNSTSYTFGAGASAALKTALAIASADITDATSDGNANKEKVLKTDSQGSLTVTNSFGVNADFGSSLTVGDGDSVKGRYDIFSNTSHFQWYSDSATYGERSFTITTENLTSSGAWVYKYPSASGTYALTASTTGVPDKLTDGTIAGTTTFNSTSYTYGTGAAATHRTALGLTTLATTTPAANVATFLETPSSANLAAAVTDETGTGALVFGTSPTIDAPTISGSAAFTSTTRPTSAGTGTPAATSLITATDRRTEEVSDLSNVYYRQIMGHELGVWATVGASPSSVIDGNSRAGCRFIGTTGLSSASAQGGGIKYPDGGLTGGSFFSLTLSFDLRFLFRNSLAATIFDVGYFTSLRNNTNFWSASSIGLYHVPQPAATWAATTAYTVGNRINVSGIVYVCSTSGTSGLTQPTFNSTINGTTNDLTAVWRTLGPHTSDKWALAFVDASGNITLTDTGVAWVSGTSNTTALRLRSNGSSVFASVNGSAEVSVSRGSLFAATPYIMCRGESATASRIAGLIWTVETSNI